MINPLEGPLEDRESEPHYRFTAAFDSTAVVDLDYGQVWTIFWGDGQH